VLVVMDGGRIEQAGSAREIYDRARTPFVVSFIGDHNVLSGKVVEQTGEMLAVEGADGSRFALAGQAAVGEQLTFSVRADHSHLHMAEAATDDVNVLAGVATAVEYAGYLVRVKLATKLASEFTLYVPEKQFGATPVHLNQPVRVSWRSEDAMQLAA